MDDNALCFDALSQWHKLSYWWIINRCVFDRDDISLYKTVESQQQLFIPPSLLCDNVIGTSIRLLSIHSYVKQWSIVVLHRFALRLSIDQRQLTCTALLDDMQWQPLIPAGSSWLFGQYCWYWARLWSNGLLQLYCMHGPAVCFPCGLCAIDIVVVVAFYWHIQVKADPSVRKTEKDVFELSNRIV